MDCAAHPGVMATGRCAGCSEPFCMNCLVDVVGEQYCGACKYMAIQGKSPVVTPTMPCAEADEALKYAIIGIFCMGIILEPLAIAKAIQAKRKIAADPRLAGNGKATAALVIGIVSLVLWVLGTIARFAAIGEV